MFMGIRPKIDTWLNVFPKVECISVEELLKGVRPKENFSDGVAITELLMTAYMSAEQGVTIKFPPPGLDQFVPMVAKGKWNPKKQ